MYLLNSNTLHVLQKKKKKKKKKTEIPVSYNEQTVRSYYGMFLSKAT